MNAVIYCRVSSKEQVDGTSLESQEIVCREHAARNHINVAKVFIERGESAKFADRTQLLELMAYCGKRTNGIEVLLVWKVDRLARNVGDHYSIKAELLKHGVRVVSVTEPIDARPEGKLLETILAGFAQFDNDLRAARTVQGMRRKIEEGLFPWKAPLGYRSTTRGDKKTQPDVPDEPTFGLLQRAWNEFATGRFSKAQMLRIMTHWGVRTAAGKPMSQQSIDRLFSDRFYAGILRDPWSGDEHVGLHIPMVNPETFAAVQRIISGRSNSQPHRATRPEFPLRAFVRCLSCEHPLSGSFCRGRSRVYPYYHCLNKQCRIRGNHRLEVVHEEFVGFLDARSPTASEIDRIRDYMENMYDRQVASLRTLEDKRKGDIDRIKHQRQQLIRLKTEQMISDDEFLKERSVLGKELADLESQLPNEGADIDDICGALNDIAQRLTNLGGMWRSLSVELQQRFQRWALPEGYVVGQIGTAQRGHLFSVFARAAELNSLMVPPCGQSWNQMTNDIQELHAILGGTAYTYERQTNAAA